MALVLNFNPSSGGVFKDKIFLTRLNLNYSNPNGGVTYPTRMARATEPPAVPPQAGFVNLLVVTATDRDDEPALAGKQFFLRIEGRKIFVLKSEFLPYEADTATPAKLLIWFIAKWKNGDPVFSTEGSSVAALTTFGVGDLVITVETEEAYLESTPVMPPAEP